MKIVILGATGMLGNAVAKHFLTSKNHEIWMSYRTNTSSVFFDNFKDKSTNDKSFFFDATCRQDLTFIPDCHYVINCIGVIKPFMKNNITDAIFINSLFPHLLAKWCKAKNTRLIHITTDCVYSGLKETESKYVESSPHDALDEYGKSKSLGEPTDKSMVIRTSIVGEELHNFASLVSWAISQKGKSVNGFINHIWNGITTKQYAKVCQQIIDQDLYSEGLFHIFSPNTITKNDMLSIFNKRWNLNLKINAVSAPRKCNRDLSTEKNLCSKLNIPTFEKMVEEL